LARLAFTRIFHDSRKHLPKGAAGAEVGLHFYIADWGDCCEFIELTPLPKSQALVMRATTNARSFDKLCAFYVSNYINVIQSGRPFAPFTQHLSL